MALDPKNPDVVALADAVAAAADKLGPLATVTLLDGHMQAVRRMVASNEFPRVLYGPEGKSATVQSKAEEEALGGGWDRNPSDEHRRPGSGGAVAATEDALSAELAVRRSQAAANPADSAAVSNAAVVPQKITSDTTTTAPFRAKPTTLGAR